MADIVRELIQLLQCLRNDIWYAKVLCITRRLQFISRNMLIGFVLVFWDVILKALCRINVHYSFISKKLIYYDTYGKYEAGKDDKFDSIQLQCILWQMHILLLCFY